MQASPAFCIIRCYIQHRTKDLIYLPQLNGFPLLRCSSLLIQQYLPSGSFLHVVTDIPDQVTKASTHFSTLTPHTCALLAEDSRGFQSITPCYHPPSTTCLPFFVSHTLLCRLSMRRQVCLGSMHDHPYWTSKMSDRMSNLHHYLRRITTLP